MSYSWTNTKLKRSEGGPGVTDAVRAVNRAKLPGVRARQTPSWYVGHTAIRVEAATKAGLRRALAVLKEMGAVSSVKDALDYAEVRS